MSNIKEIRPKIDTDDVLEKAKGNYGSVLLIGWNKEGELDVRSSGDLQGKDILWLTQLVAHKLMNGDYNV